MKNSELVRKYKAERKKKIYRYKINKKRRIRNKIFIESLKKECNICGSKKHRLIFHHPNPENKTCSVSSLVDASRKRILEEAKKCIVVCYKCHNKIHKEDRINGIRALNDKYNCNIKV